MNIEYTKVDAYTLKVTTTPDAIQPAPQEQNYSLDYLTQRALDLPNERQEIVDRHTQELAAKDAEIAANEALIAKCSELDICACPDDFKVEQ